MDDGGGPWPSVGVVALDGSPWAGVVVGCEYLRIKHIYPTKPPKVHWCRRRRRAWASVAVGASVAMRGGVRGGRWAGVVIFSAVMN